MQNHTKQSQTLSLDNISTKTLTAGILLAIAVFLPSIIYNQAITGPIINAVLLLSTVLLGPSTAIMIGLIPSVAALSRGLLPLPLAPIVPFIMLANGLYIYAFHALQKKSFALAVIAASMLKFAFLHFTSQFLLAGLLPAQFLTPAANMMSWPQLATALAGGLITWVVCQTLPILNLHKK